MKRIAYFVLVLLALVLVQQSLGQSVDGQRRWKRTLKPKEVVEYILEFRGPAAEFAVIGNGATDVDIFVYQFLGEALNPVANDTNQVDIAKVAWQNRGGRYLVRVVNLGEKENECYMAHN